MNLCLEKFHTRQSVNQEASGALEATATVSPRNLGPNLTRQLAAPPGVRRSVTQLRLGASNALLSLASRSANPFRPFFAYFARIFAILPHLNAAHIYHSPRLSGSIRGAPGAVADPATVTLPVPCCNRRVDCLRSPHNKQRKNAEFEMRRLISQPDDVDALRSCRRRSARRTPRGGAAADRSEKRGERIQEKKDADCAREAPTEGQRDLSRD
ncbi:hypothetical protein L596_018541 [Steinernema carpocapsae]|uniref:Uncharacterized protein n=1 Tax=Steinernema carpocapsae TaxID=34508 RepID=A0A4U5N4Y9_STECR|nr:hypothetical protein L596_018541 [Steinernema carpocapsae]